MTLDQIIKQMATNVIESADPTNFMFGEVVNISPLQIKIDSKLTLNENVLIKTSLVSDFDIDVSLDIYTEVENEHRHEIKGDKVLNVKLGLKKGERVILMRQHGGQKYIILDRVR